MGEQTGKAHPLIPTRTAACRAGSKCHTGEPLRHQSGHLGELCSRQCFLWVRSTVSSDGNTHTRTMNRGAKISPPAGQTVCPMSDLERPAFSSPQHARCSFLAILTTAASPSLLPDLTCDSQQQMLSFSMTFFQTGFQTDGFPGRSQNYHRMEHPTPECRPWSATEPTIASRCFSLPRSRPFFYTNGSKLEPRPGWTRPRVFWDGVGRTTMSRGFK